jgi:hypothetical protein
MATVVTTLTTAEVGQHIAHVDPPAYAAVEAAALRKLVAAHPNYNITKVEVSQGGAVALRFTITYTPKPLDPNKAKATLRA